MSTHSSHPARGRPEGTFTRLEEAIERFEKAWQAGGPPALADYLPPDGEARQALLVELVRTDLQFRTKGGEAVRVETYLRQFPELSADSLAVLDLICAEFWLRNRFGAGVSPAEVF